MRRFNGLILAGAAMCSLAGAAFAADKPGDPMTDPSLQEMKTSKDRGIIAVPLPTVPIIKPEKVESIEITRPQPDKKTTLPQKKAITPPQHAQAAAAVPPKHAHTAGVTKPHPIVVTKKTETPTVHQTTKVQQNTITPAAFTPDAQAMVKVWLNKPGTTPRYHTGEKMEINVTAAKDCNLMIFDFDGRGRLTQLFPNQYQSTSEVKAGETVAIGGDKSSFDYTASLPHGHDRSNEKIFVYAYPLGDNNTAPLSVAMNPTDSVFRSKEITLEEYRKLVNESKVFFARDVQVTPKKGVIVADSDVHQASAPNKYELGFVIEK